MADTQSGSVAVIENISPQEITIRPSPARGHVLRDDIVYLPVGVQSEVPANLYLLLESQLKELERIKFIVIISAPPSSSQATVNLLRDAVFIADDKVAQGGELFLGRQ